jgi:hypothetical protein
MNSDIIRIPITIAGMDRAATMKSPAVLLRSLTVNQNVPARYTIRIPTIIEVPATSKECIVVSYMFIGTTTLGPTF